MNKALKLVLPDELLLNLETNRKPTSESIVFGDLHDRQKLLPVS